MRAREFHPVIALIQLFNCPGRLNVPFLMVPQPKAPPKFHFLESPSGAKPAPADRLCSSWLSWAIMSLLGASPLPLLRRRSRQHPGVYSLGKAQPERHSKANRACKWSSKIDPQTSLAGAGRFIPTRTELIAPVFSRTRTFPELLLRSVGNCEKPQNADGQNHLHLLKTFRKVNRLLDTLMSVE